MGLTFNVARNWAVSDAPGKLKLVFLSRYVGRNWSDLRISFLSRAKSRYMLRGLLGGTWRKEGLRRSQVGPKNFTSPGKHANQSFRRLEHGIDRPRMQNR